MTPPLSPEEVLLTKFLRFCAVLYGVSGVGFAVLHPVMFDLVRPITDLLGLTATPAPSERFWLTLSLSMMLMLVVCCTLGARDIRRNQDMCIPIIFSKFCSTLCGVLFFVAAAPYGMYLTIATTDLPLGIVTLILWRRARASVPA